MKISEKYLPVGTVVMLKGGSKRLMIVGFCAIDGANPNQIWDYSGCLYPEGILSSNQAALFNHEQIEKVCYMGLADDEEEKSFKEKLKGIKKLTEKNKKN